MDGNNSDDEELERFENLREGFERLGKRIGEEGQWLREEKAEANELRLTLEVAKVPGMFEGAKVAEERMRDLQQSIDAQKSTIISQAIGKSCRKDQDLQRLQTQCLEIIELVEADVAEIERLV